MKAKRASSAVAIALASSPTSMTMMVTMTTMAVTTVSPPPVRGFAPPPATFGTAQPSSAAPRTTATTGGTSLCAIGVFVRKAKEADVRRYLEEEGPSESVLGLLGRIRDAAAADPAPPPPRADVGTGGGAGRRAPGRLQSLLTKRRGTISVIAEYKRAPSGSGFLADVPDPELLSPVFREFGASAVAVLACERTGGCTYADVRTVVDEQDAAEGSVPGPLPVISSDPVVDEVQIARACDAGAVAVTIVLGMVGTEAAARLVRGAEALGMESVIEVSTPEEATRAVRECGASIVRVSGGTGGAESKRAVASPLLGPGFAAPDGRPVCLVASVLARGNKALEEVEEAWELRDSGFHSVWVSDALYKSGNDPAEHPGAIIGSMRAKSSVKYASPKARSGKGEGAREYLGDILM